MSERIPFSQYEMERWNPKQEQMCAFHNRLGIDPDPNPCDGVMTEHHVQYLSEDGNGDCKNIIPLCEGHQIFVHSKENWGE